MSFQETEFGSDTDDDDYVPTGDGHDASEEENSGDDEGAFDGSKKGKRKSLKSKNHPAKRGGLFDDGESKASREKEFEAEKKEIEEEKEKKKTDDLWADFLKDSKPAAKPKPATGSGLGTLGMVVSSKPKTQPQSAKPKGVVSSIFDSLPSSSTDDKSKAESKPRSIVSSIFDSISTAPSKKEEAKPRSIVSSIFDSIPEKASKEEPKKAEESQADSGKMKITRMFDFAGENVEVTKEVDKDSDEAQKFMKDKEKAEAKASVKRPGGLSSIMDVISGKKQKMGTLDKSKLDWNKFVEDEGIKEDLTTFNKGKDGYVEKQMFLERTDHRRFEIEKAAREKTRKTFHR